MLTNRVESGVVTASQVSFALCPASYSYVQSKAKAGEWAAMGRLDWVRLGCADSVYHVSAWALCEPRERGEGEGPMTASDCMHGHNKATGAAVAIKAMKHR